MRRRLKRLIDPVPQVTVDEQLLAQQGGQIGQAPAEAGAQLQVFEQEHGNQGGPYLDLQGVGAGADEGLDAQVLFEGLEQEFYLPALFIDGGDGGGSEVTMVGEKDQGALLGLVPDLDAAQEQVAVCAGQLVEEDDLIALDGAAFRDRAALQHAVIGVVLHAGDEEDALLVEDGEPVIVAVASVEDHDGAGIEAQGGGDAALVHAAFGDDGVAGQQALMIEQQMQLDGPLGAPVLRPVEDSGAQLDQGGVEREQLVLESKPMTSSHFAAASEQLIEHAPVKLPRPVLVGVGQGGARGRLRQSQMPQLALAGGQPAADLAQRLRPSQVAKQHGHELAPAGETAGMALRPVLGHNPLKLVAGKQLQHLAENAGYSCHGGGGPPDADYVFSTQTVTEFYRRRSKPNLDKSDIGYGCAAQ